MLNAVGGTKYNTKVLTFKPKGSARTLTYKTGIFLFKMGAKIVFFLQISCLLSIRTHITIV